MTLPELLPPSSIFLAFLLLSTLFLSHPTLFSFSSFLSSALHLLEQNENSAFLSQTDPLPKTIAQIHPLPTLIAHQHPRLPHPKHAASHDSKETFLVPLLTSHVGDNNQLVEYLTAAVVARATQRTLCLTPFFSGPAKHGGQLPRLQNNGLAIEERYDVKNLSKFVNVTAQDRCLAICDKKLDSFWWLRETYAPRIQQWTWDPSNVTTHNLSWSFVKWTSTKEIDETFRPYARERCVALGGLFPGLRWRGAYLAAASYIRAANPISDAVSALQVQAIGTDRPFLAVHWRFHESNCKGYELGLCFLRCGDGSVIDSGLHPAAREWMELGKHQCPRDRLHFRGVAVAKEDLIDAIRERAKKDNLTTVYLATDGWMRGPTEQALVKEVVKSLRRSGLAVVGLWKIKKLPNFSDGSYFRLSSLRSFLPEVSGHTVSQIEQEICSRAYSFLGSGESTWSLSVFRSRLARRRHERIRQNVKAEGSELGEREDEYVIESLLGDKHAAGLQCQYQAFYNRAKVNATEETYEDEEPDGWVDIEACEGRIGKGGKCKVAACF